MSEPAARDERNNQLDGLRGYAALAVVFFHSILGLDVTLIDQILNRHFFQIDGIYNRFVKIALTILNGHTAVAIFFVLSGAVLFDSLRREQGNAISVSMKFLVRRFFRIYPALFVCLLACWITFYTIGTPRSGSQLLQNLVLYDFSINGATWTLNVEAFGAILMLLAFFAYRYLGDAGIIIVGCIFASAYLRPFQGYLLFFKLYIYSFILGMMIPTRLGKWIIGYIPAASWPVLFLGVLFARYTIQETIIALLVGMIYYRKVGALGQFLSKPISVFLGTISYSLYLFNVVFLEIILDRLKTYPTAVAHPVEFGIVAAIVIIALTGPVAYWSVRFIERPSIWLGRQLTRGRTDPAIASDNAPSMARL